MKKLLSAVLTTIVVACIIYGPYGLAVRHYTLGLPDKTEGVVWYVILSIGYYVVNWFIGMTIIAGAAIVLIFTLFVGTFTYHLFQEIYDTIFAALDWSSLRLRRYILNRKRKEYIK